MTSRRRAKKERSGQESKPFGFLLILFTEILIISLILAIFCFWWYKWRPAKIISHCSVLSQQKATEKNEEDGGPTGKYKASDRNQYYRWCLQENGLEK
ncbi:hypothetical protein GF382_02990 [Candidatus Falkowbacteria bacterium]|nr:hypothetical protein [Candidatus Falkowbacteria bacterium]